MTATETPTEPPWKLIEYTFAFQLVMLVVTGWIAVTHGLLSLRLLGTGVVVLTVGLLCIHRFGVQAQQTEQPPTVRCTACGQTTSADNVGGGMMHKLLHAEQGEDAEFEVVKTE